MVETFTDTNDRTIQKIRFCLQGYPEGLTPKLIAAKTGLNVNTVKSALPKMGDVKKVLRGLYKVLPEGDGGVKSLLPFDYNFHNLVLSVEVLNLSDVVVVGVVFDCGLSRCVLDVSNGVSYFRLSSDFPLNVSSLGVVSRFFVEVVKGYGLVLNGPVMVRSVEFNHDFSNLRLDGLNSVSLDGLFEQFKLYQKSRGLRVEHKTKVPVGVDVIVDMLVNKPNSLELNVKLSEHSALIRRLADATSANSRMLLKLIDREGERR